jgi:hypothetical protein
MRLTSGYWWIWLCHICCLCILVMCSVLGFWDLDFQVWHLELAWQQAIFTMDYAWVLKLLCDEHALWTGKCGLFAGCWLSHIQFHISSIFLTQITSELDTILLYMKAVYGSSFCWVLPFCHLQVSFNFEENGILLGNMSFPSKCVHLFKFQSYMPSYILLSSHTTIAHCKPLD